MHVRGYEICSKIKEHLFLVINVENNEHLRVSVGGSTTSYNRLMRSLAGIS